MNIKDIFKNINFHEFQYNDGYFIRTNSVIKTKNKPNKLYDYNISVKYCKCCDIIYSISITKENTTFYYDKDNENPNSEIVDFELNGKYFKFVTRENIEKIVKEIIHK